MLPFGLPEFLIILAILLLLIGVGRIGPIGEELGKAIKSFRQALKDDRSDDQTK